MKRKVVVILLCVFMLNLLGPGTLWAKSDYKFKDCIPPGLLKNGKIVPAQFQNMMFSWKGEIEGQIVYKATINNINWIVVKSKDTIKAFMLLSGKNYSVGDWVEVEYFLDKAIEIDMIDETDDDDDDDDEDDNDNYADKYLLNYGLTMTPNKVYSGEKVSFKLEAKNNTNKNIAVHFNSGQRYDFVVKKDGKKLWSWSEGYDFITVIQNLTFSPGKKETYIGEWVSGEPGKYTVEAYFMGQSRTKPVLVKEFTVLPKTQEKNLKYQLEVIKGEPNLFILKVTNPSDTALNVNLPTGQIFDFLLTKNGQKLWQWSDGQSFTQATQNLSFAAKETKIYYAQYTTTSKGEYQLYGFFKGETNKTVGPEAFTVK